MDQETGGRRTDIHKGVYLAMNRKRVGEILLPTSRKKNYTHKAMSMVTKQKKESMLSVKIMRIDPFLYYIIFFHVTEYV